MKMFKFACLLAIAVFVSCNNAPERPETVLPEAQKTEAQKSDAQRNEAQRTETKRTPPPSTSANPIASAPSQFGTPGVTTVNHPVAKDGKSAALVRVPDLKCQIVTDIRKVIIDNDLIIGTIQMIGNVDDVESGYVVSQFPTFESKAMMASGSSVNLVVQQNKPAGCN